MATENMVNDGRVATYPKLREREIRSRSSDDETSYLSTSSIGSGSSSRPSFSTASTIMSSSGSGDSCDATTSANVAPSFPLQGASRMVQHINPPTKEKLSTTEKKDEALARDVRDEQVPAFIASTCPPSDAKELKHLSELSFDDYEKLHFPEWSVVSSHTGTNTREAALDANAVDGRLPAHPPTVQHAISIISHQKVINNELFEGVVRQSQTTKMVVEDAVEQSETLCRLKKDLTNTNVALQAAESHLQMLSLRCQQEQQKQPSSSAFKSSDILLQRKDSLGKTLEEKAIESARKDAKLERLKMELQEMMHAEKSSIEQFLMVQEQREANLKDVAAPPSAAKGRGGNHPAPQHLARMSPTICTTTTTRQLIRQLEGKLQKADQELQKTERLGQSLLQELKVVKESAAGFMKGEVDNIKAREDECHAMIVAQRSKINELSRTTKKEGDLIQAYEERCSYLEQKIERREMRKQATGFRGLVAGRSFSRKQQQHQDRGRAPLSEWRRNSSRNLMLSPSPSCSAAAASDGGGSTVSTDQHPQEQH